MCAPPDAHTPVDAYTPGISLESPWNLRSTPIPPALTHQVRLTDYGATLIEVADNGSGIPPDGYAGATLKHHTSKMGDFADLLQVCGWRVRMCCVFACVRACNLHGATPNLDLKPKNQIATGAGHVPLQWRSAAFAVRADTPYAHTFTHHHSRHFDPDPTHTRMHAHAHVAHMAPQEVVPILSKQGLGTYGFRGEALSSLCALSAELSIVTRTRGQGAAVSVVVLGPAAAAAARASTVRASAGSTGGAQAWGGYARQGLGASV